MQIRILWAAIDSVTFKKQIAPNGGYANPNPPSSSPQQQ